MELELSGKTALVTGSSEGIGRAIAEVLIGEGCQVAVNARNANKLKTCASSIGAASAIVGDVANPLEARRVVDETLQGLGRLDILICNVGSGSSVPPGEETFEEWQRAFALNLWSATNTVEAARELGQLAQFRRDRSLQAVSLQQEVFRGGSQAAEVCRKSLREEVRSQDDAALQLR